MLLLKLDDDDAQIVLDALGEKWSQLDRRRRDMMPPDDQPIIDRQQRIEAIQQVLRMGMG